VFYSFLYYYVKEAKEMRDTRCGCHSIWKNDSWVPCT